jgi:anhydro-N-acetylmuramic acid kinase
MSRVIGLMSGTSVDGVDAALVEIQGSETDLCVELIAADTYDYEPALRQTILEVCGGKPLSFEAMAELDDAIATTFAQAAQAIQVNQAPATLIGSHGQTVYHRPPHGSGLGYTLQLGRGALIAHQTGITTVCNFRQADMDAGGQGAPLVSKLDVCLLGDATQSRCVQNIGGIGNLTFVPPRHPAALGAGVQGWDTGPGNVLIDLAVQQFSQGQQTYDQDGAWAASGTPCQALVDQWLKHTFFQTPPPKSTGRELFGLQFWQHCLWDAEAYTLSEADVLATLTEFTAASIVHNYQHFLPQMPDRVLLCGGGSRNQYLRQRLQALLGEIPVQTTTDYGLEANAKEAIAFAVLAYWRQQHIPGNLPEVTGASQAVLLGDLYPA